ncbi:cupin domain-containing protein [Amaricoccus macauensis]|uniref:cupin domain-containing protein n=1 Tax=Amaricoccus macauensis TaxID=57001 RepID=UPI003C7A9325
MGVSAYRANLEETEQAHWDDARHGRVSFRVLLSSDATPSKGLVKGIADLGPGDVERIHRHDRPESVLVLEGTGEAEIDGEVYEMRPGDVFFVPENCWHEWRTKGERIRFLFTFPADRLNDVTYVYPEDA